LGIVRHAAGKQGFTVQPRRWVVERTFGWLVRNRRLAKDYERKPQTSETLIEWEPFACCFVVAREAPKPWPLRRREVARTSDLRSWLNSYVM
jgi:putative transposase